MMQSTGYKFCNGLGWLHSGSVVESLLSSRLARLRIFFLFTEATKDEMTLSGVHIDLGAQDASLIENIWRPV